jgi:2'-hydroxyisoflavone reductase
MAFYYWLQKLTGRAEFIAPGSGEDPVQYVDVRDVGRWIIDCVEASRSGVYNAFSRPTPFRSFLDQCHAGVGGRAKAVWVDGDFLHKTEKVATFNGMPLWNPDRPGFATISTAKAEAVGWKQRPLSETARDALASYRQRFPAGVTFPSKEGTLEWGISDERERQILAEWRARKT